MKMSAFEFLVWAKSEGLGKGAKFGFTLKVAEDVKNPSTIS